MISISALENWEESPSIKAVYGSTLSFKCTPQLVAPNDAHPPCLLVYTYNLAPLSDGFALGFAYYWLTFNYERVMDRLCESHVKKMSDNTAYFTKLFTMISLSSVGSAVVFLPVLSIGYAGDNASIYGYNNNPIIEIIMIYFIFFFFPPRCCNRLLYFYFITYFYSWDRVPSIVCIHCEHSLWFGVCSFHCRSSSVEMDVSRLHELLL
jgi:hypothetical protein